MNSYSGQIFIVGLPECLVVGGTHQTRRGGAGPEPALPQAAFRIDWDARKVTCPQGAVTGCLCWSMYCRMMLSGAPPQDAAKEDGDQKCPCMMCRFTRPVNCDRRPGRHTLEAVHQAIQYGRTFARIGRFEPTSQVCSACGVKDGPKPLHVREWTCAACGTAHDRDVNAARNILAAGRADKSNGCGAGVRPHLAAAGAEAGTHRSAA